MRSINASVRCFMLTTFLMLMASNAHAYLVNSALNSFNIHLVPAVPNSNMSIEWTDYRASAGATAYQLNDDESIQNDTSVPIGEPSSTTVGAETEDARISIDINDNDASFTVDFSENSPDHLRCNGDWVLTRDFKINGDGWLLISVEHSVGYPNIQTPQIDLRSTAELYLDNLSLYGWQHSVSYLDAYRPHLTEDLLGVGQFFNDGDNGYFRVALSDYVNNGVPIPGAIWLLGFGLSCLAAIKKAYR